MTTERAPPDRVDTPRTPPESPMVAMDDALHIRPVKTDGRSSSTASSRAAANLSLERLYRKRAIDRENQRVLRQKNKARLAELEAEVRALTARLEQAEADKALQAARTQTSSSSLEAIITSLQSLQGSLGQLGAAAGSTPSPSPVASSSVVSSSAMFSVASATAAGTASLSPAASVRSDSTATKVGDPAHGHVDHPMGGTGLALNLDNLDVWGSGASVTVPVDDDDILFQNSDFTLDIDLLTRSLPLFQSDGPADGHSPTSPTHSRTNHTPPHLPSSPYNLHRTAAGVDFQAPSSPPTPSAAGDSLRRNPHDDTGAVYLARAEANRLRDASPIWAVTPAYVPPTSNVDELIINLVSKRRRGEGGVTKTEGESAGVTAASATSATSATSAISTASTATDEFAHAHFPSVNSLLNPVLYEPDKPVASTIARHVAGTIMVYTTPEKTALLYMMCIFIRWLISPTKEHYDSIPEFFRPTAAQLVVPHPFWIDTLGWPRARERLVRHFDHTCYRAFASTIVKSFSIGWPHHALDGILEGSPDKGFVMTRAFVQHVREPANWTVGPELVEAFPFLEGAVNVRGRPPVSF